MLLIGFVISFWNFFQISYVHYLCAYPGSEFVVANILAKWKKLEPNEINFSEGFNQKVSTILKE